jgi:glycosyltransferase involved in cell wall biosynthesis
MSRLPPMVSKHLSQVVSSQRHVCYRHQDSSWNNQHEIMKIAIMMRPIDQDSGFHAYVDGLVDALLRIDTKNQYLLFYRTAKWLGRFASFKNSREILVRAPNKLLWDQVAVPYHAWRERADVVFNPKFSVPLICSCPTAMGLQEAGMWVEPQYYARWDVVYTRVMWPIYCRRAAHLFPMAKFILDENRKYMGLPLKTATVTYPAPQDHLKPVSDLAGLESFRKTYKLPQRFILSVTRVDHPGLDNSRSFYPGKNPQATLRAFLLCRDKIPHQLVFAGRRVREFFLHLGFQEADFERVHFINFVPFKELAKLYSLADLIVVPPFYEGFGFALLGALACGCPAVVSKTGTCPEVVGNAGLLADPHDPADIAEKILAVTNDENLRQTLRKKGLERAATFTWEKAARLTLDALTGVVDNHRKVRQ